MNLPAQSQKLSSRPTTASREMVNLIGRFSSALEEIPGQWKLRQIAHTSAPSAGERATLQARRDELEATISGCDEAAIVRNIGIMRSGFTGGHNVENPALVVKLYVSALMQFPEWVVSEACRLVINGLAGTDPRFPPGPPEMANLCRAIVQPFRDEIAKLELILNAQVYRAVSDEDRARNLRLFAELVRDLGKGADDEGQLRAARQEQLTRDMVEASRRNVEEGLRLAGIADGSPMSLELRQKLGLVETRSKGDF